jgi:transcriptional regulator with XRE-family HTH domain
VRGSKKAYFADWLHRTLNEQDISGGEVARAVGVNDSAVSRWRNGRGRPGLDSIRKLARFLEVNPIRLAVTAGLIDPDEAGVEPLELPEDTRKHQQVRDQIASIRDLSTSEREALMQTYDRMTREPSEG